ncbi:hypothetical protein HaLaN_19014, partial [Haematococcus lacustris]
MCGCSSSSRQSSGGQTVPWPMGHLVWIAAAPLVAGVAAASEKQGEAIPSQGPDVLNKQQQYHQVL